MGTSRGSQLENSRRDTAPGYHRSSGGLTAMHVRNLAISLLRAVEVVGMHEERIYIDCGPWRDVLHQVRWSSVCRSSGVEVRSGTNNPIIPVKILTNCSPCTADAGSLPSCCVSLDTRYYLSNKTWVSQFQHTTWTLTHPKTRGKSRR